MLSGSFRGTTIAGNSGSAGSSYSELYNPTAIYVDPNRVMYILDQTNYRILRWTYGEPRGYLAAGGNGAGSAYSQFSTSYAMFVDSQNNIYVSDSGNSRVTLWTPGNRTWSTLVRSMRKASILTIFCYQVAGGNGAGNTATRLNGPWGVYVDSNQAVFVVDRNNHRVQCWVLGK
jgi:hypothetical protein